MRSRLLLLTAFVAATAVLVATPSTATVPAGSDVPRMRSIPLPDDFAPEGIAVGPHNKFFVGSLWDGDIYRGNLKTGRGKVVVDRKRGQAVGLKVDAARYRLYVAAGLTGRALVYDTRDGSKIASIRLARKGKALINDVVLTRDAAYFTDSFNPRIYKVPIGPDGTLGSPERIIVTGEADFVGELGVGLNGIDAPVDGRVLIVANSSRGLLYTVDPESGRSDDIELDTGTPLPDTIDGILLQRRVVWVLSNFSNTLTKIRLDPDFSEGRVVQVITNDDVGGLFRVPTTLAAHKRKLVIVNARFDLGLPPPFGAGAPEGTDYDVVVIPRNLPAMG